MPFSFNSHGFYSQLQGTRPCTSLLHIKLAIATCKAIHQTLQLALVMKKKLKEETSMEQGRRRVCKWDSTFSKFIIATQMGGARCIKWGVCFTCSMWTKAINECNWGNEISGNRLMLILSILHQIVPFKYHCDRPSLLYNNGSDDFRN